MEDILCEIERDQSFSGVHSVRVNRKRDGSGRAKGATEANNAKENGGDDPMVFLGGLSKSRSQHFLIVHVSELTRLFLLGDHRPENYLHSSQNP